MKISFKKFIINFIERAHLKLFHAPIGNEMRKFVSNLSFMGLGTIIAGLFIFITNILAGRWLGPAEYGKYSLLISLGNFFIIPMLLGLNTSLAKYLPNAKNTDDKKNIITSILIPILFIIAISIILLLILQNSIVKILKIENNIYLLGIIYATFLTLKLITEAILKGLHKFKNLSLLNVINAITTLVFFLGAIFLTKKYVFETYIEATIFGLIIFIIIVAWQQRKYFGSFKAKIFKEIIQYGGYATLGSIGGFILYNSDRFILNSYLGTSAVGLYMVYLTASYFLTNQLLQIFINVFFPSVSAIKKNDTHEIFKKLIKLFKTSSLFILIFNFITIAIIVKFYGNQYEFNLTYILLFSIFNWLSNLQSIIWWFIAALGKREIRFTSITGLIAGGLNIILLFIMINKFQILGAILALNIISLLLLIAGIIYLNKDKDAPNSKRILGK